WQFRRSHVEGRSRPGRSRSHWPWRTTCHFARSCNRQCHRKRHRSSSAPSAIHARSDTGSTGKERRALFMNAFEYAAPTTKEQAVRLLGSQWGATEILAGGTDLLSLMKDHLTTPKRVVNIKDIKEFQGIKYNASTGLRLGALVTLDELLSN